MALAAVSFRTNELVHHGVKGMKWGVRKDRTPGIAREGPNYQLFKDGSIRLEKGAIVQRIVRKHSSLIGGSASDLGVQNGMYASFLPSDKHLYEHGFGRSKGLLVKEASQVLTFTVKSPLKSPGVLEARDLYFDMLRNDPELHEKVKRSIRGINIDKVMSGDNESAKNELYSTAYDAGNYNSKLSGVNHKYTSILKKKGYNMLMDPADSLNGEFDAPIVILDSSKSVELSSRRIVDKESQKRVRKLVRDDVRISKGKTFLSELGVV